MTLEAVQQATLADGAGEARQILAAARARAAAQLDRARGEAATLIERRRAAAEQLADLEERELLAQARAQARTITLCAQRSVMLEAGRDARQAVRSLPHDHRYAALLERLAADARRRLAFAGPVEIAVAPDGGLLASAGSRAIDYSLSAQVDRCLHAMAADQDRLWR